MRTTIAVVTVLLAGSCVGVPGASGASRAATRPPPAVRLSRTPIAELARWQAYDEAPASPVITPVRVLEVTGDVLDAQALADPGSGQTTTLTYPVGGSAPSLIVDFGKDGGGFPEIDVASGSGAIATSYSETLHNLGDDGATSVTLFQSGDGERNDLFTALGAGTLRASAIQGGERYEKLTLATPGSVTLKSVAIDFTPLRETPATMAGHFLSSDDLLNRIWYSGAYTLNLNQLTPGTPVADGGVNQLHLILDGAKRDRAVWSGDHMISDLTDYYVSDPAYARDSLALFLDHPASSAGFLIPAVGVMSQPGPLPGACSPNPIVGDLCVSWSASYALAVIPAVANYYRYTGDRAFIRDHWPAVVRDMAWAATQVDSQGLFAVTSGDDDDWNLESTTGEVTYVNALYVQALRSAATLAVAVGEGAEAATWSHAADNVTAVANRVLWDPKTGVYDSSNTLRGAVVQDANVLAILAGLASPQRSRVILGTLARALATPYGPVAATANATGYTRDISPYMGSFNVLADFASGDTSAALALMRQEWGFMISHDPGGVDWERIQPNGIPAGTSGSLLVADSSAHAWSTGPTAAMSEYLLGAAPATPGYATWSMSPQLGNLAWAQGTVPTPHGALAIRWRRAPRNSSFALTVAAPAGTSGSVAVPVLGAQRTIARNGHVVWSHGRPARGVTAHRVGGAVVFTQGAGVATYAWAR